MNPEIKLSILAVWTLLASTTCRFCCDAQSTREIFKFESQERLNAVQNQPPLCVYPPPSFWPPPLSALPPPPYTRPEHGVWCVAKPTVPASLMQQALDYACSSGADCGPIRLNGLCYQPDTVLAHASYAFNSCWQRTKRAGGTCEFGGAAMLVTSDPSYDQCRFIYS